MAANETSAPLETSHAVFATGDSRELPGGRSRQTALGVPILELSDYLAREVTNSAQAHVDPDQEAEYLIGETVVLHNPVPQDGIDTDDDTVIFHIGAETLDEAAKSVVGAFESTYGTRGPTWVNSTHPLLGAVIADHYGCENHSQEA